MPVVPPSSYGLRRTHCHDGNGCGLRGAAFVVVVQPTEVRNRHDLAFVA